MTQIEADLWLRDARPGDETVLFDWHAAAFRAHIERRHAWDESAQRRDFARLFAALPPRVVCRADSDIGYIQIQRRDNALHLANIVLCPPARGQGAGSALLRYLQGQAAQRGLAVTLKVFLGNTRAGAFYRRHGFAVTARNTTHRAMRWSARV